MSVKLSIIIVTYNSKRVIKETVSSLVNCLDISDYEIIIVDNCSTDNTVQLISDLNYDRVKVIVNKKNCGFATANNIGVKESKGKYILILNPDIVFTTETNIAHLINKFSPDTHYAIVAPKLLYTDGRVQESARTFPNPFVLLIRGLHIEKYFYKFHFYRTFLLLDKELGADIHPDWVIGAFMLLRRETFKHLGGFDEKYFMYYEDADLCYRASQLGYKILYTDSTYAIHQYQRESAKKLFSKLKYHHIKSIIRFLFKRNFPRLIRDKQKFQAYL